MSPPANSVEGNIIVLVQWLKLAVESFGAGLVAVGVGVTIVQVVRTWREAASSVLPPSV